MALPAIEGRILREVLLRHVGGTSNKEYRITVSQDANGNAYCYSAHGPTGKIHTGRLETPANCTVWEAGRKADELIDKKQSRSKTPYSLISDQVSPLRTHRRRPRLFLGPSLFKPKQPPCVRHLRQAWLSSTTSFKRSRS